MDSGDEGGNEVGDGLMVIGIDGEREKKEERENRRKEGRIGKTEREERKKQSVAVLIRNTFFVKPQTQTPKTHSIRLNFH